MFKFFQFSPDVTPEEDPEQAFARELQEILRAFYNMFPSELDSRREREILASSAAQRAA